MISILRWLSRITSVISIAMLLIFLISENFSMSTLTARELLLSVFFPVGVITGMIVSWFREGTGGLLSIFSLGMFYAMSFYLTGEFPKGPYFLLFTLPAFIFLWYWSASFTDAFKKMQT